MFPFGLPIKEWERIKSSVKTGIIQEENIKFRSVITKNSKIPKEWCDYYVELNKNKKLSKTNDKNYNFIPKNRANERDEYVKTKKEQLFTPLYPLDPVLIGKAILEETLLEREVQLQLKKIQKEDEEKINETYKKQGEAKAKNILERKKLRKEEIMKRKIHLREFLQNQINENFQRKENEKLKRRKTGMVERTIIELLRKEEELEQLKKEQQTKETLFQEMLKYHKKSEDNKKEMKEQEESNRILDEIYCEAKQLVQDLINKKELERRKIHHLP